MKVSIDDIGEIGWLVGEGPEGRHAQEVASEVIAADVRPPDEAALPGASDRKCVSKLAAVEPVVVHLRALCPLADVSTIQDLGPLSPGRALIKGTARCVGMALRCLKS